MFGRRRHGNDDDDADVLYKLKQGHSLVAAVAHQQFWMVRVLTAITLMPNCVGSLQVSVLLRKRV